MKQIINKEGDVIGVDDAYVLKEGEVWAEGVDVPGEDDAPKEGEVVEEKSEEQQVIEKTHEGDEELPV